MEWQTDKASMLDEIIDYVKFLQLQVKVLFPGFTPLLIFVNLILFLISIKYSRILIMDLII